MCIILYFIHIRHFSTSSKLLYVAIKITHDRGSYSSPFTINPSKLKDIVINNHIPIYCELVPYFKRLDNV